MAQPGNPWLAPIYLPGSEPYPPGTTEEEKEGYRQMQRWTKVGGDFMHYCPTKVAMAGGMGFALGGFVSLMGATFALDDPLSRANQQLTTGGKTMAVVKDMGRNMLSQGRGFAKVGALYSGYECVIEGVASCTSTGLSSRRQARLSAPSGKCHIGTSAPHGAPAFPSLAPPRPLPPLPSRVPRQERPLERYRGWFLCRRDARTQVWAVGLLAGWAGLCGVLGRH